MRGISILREKRIRILAGSASLHRVVSEGGIFSNSFRPPLFNSNCECPVFCHIYPISFFDVGIAVLLLFAREFVKPYTFSDSPRALSRCMRVAASGRASARAQLAGFANVAVYAGSR